MKSQNLKQVKDILHANQPTSRNFKQEFQYADQLIIHHHHVTVSHIPHDHNFEIRNQLTVQKEASLEKVTQILLENRIIKIIDTFESLHNLSPISNQSGFAQKRAQSGKKYTIFKQREEQEQAHKAKDTKNVVKNIIRLFQSWLEDDLPKYKPVYDLLEGFVEKTKFNNNLIMKMLKQEELRTAFLTFGLKQARHFILKSKIHDKRTHFQVLEKYLNIFQLETAGEVKEKNKDEEAIEIFEKIVK